MKIRKILPNGSRIIECGFCSGTGTHPDLPTIDHFDETCDVCNGSGVIMERADEEYLMDCARCRGEGKGYRGGYFLGDVCEVCKGKGYVVLSESDYPELWDLLHPNVRKASRQLFEDDNYTEAVFKAIKALNFELKEYYRQKTGKELDGSDLVSRILSLKDPIIKVADLTTESGRNMQQGLMLMMQGLFIGVRNPITHDRTIGLQYCMHILFVISLIHNQLDYSEMRPQKELEDRETSGDPEPV